MCIVVFVALEREVSKSHNYFQRITRDIKTNTLLFMYFSVLPGANAHVLVLPNEPNAVFYVLNS